GLIHARPNLPVELSSFLGRERELRELTAMLPITRLLTLVGSGGVGKSRLALRLAASQVDTYAADVRLGELAALTDPELLTQAVAVVLGVHDQLGVPLVATLVAALHARRLLLMLDNCEHLVEACAQLVAVLLRGCPDLRIVATSRVVLGVTGERVWPV